MNFEKFLRTSFFTEHLLLAASAMISNDCNDKRDDVTNPQEMEMEERKKQMEERQLKENLCLLEFINMF